MEKYVTPEVELIELESEDIIMTSGEGIYVPGDNELPPIDLN